MKVTKLIMTCRACPSQWEGKLDDGRMFYIRYRWGGLSVRVSAVVTDDVMDAVGGTELLYRNVGGGMDGSMTEEEMIKIVSEVFEFEES